MQLYEILPEEDLSIEKVMDQSSADRFLSRLDKKEAKFSQPAVAKKIEELDAHIEELKGNNPNDSKIEGLEAAIGRLKQWQKDNPLIRVTNPGRTAIGGPGTLSGTGRYNNKSSSF